MFVKFESAFVALLVLLVCFASALSAGAQQESPSIEEMLTEAATNSRKESAQITAKVKAQMMAFRFQGKGSDSTHDTARKNLVEMGFGAVPGIVEALKKTKNARLLTHIYATLCEMHAAKTASTSEIATHLRNLIDAKEPFQSATVIAVLGTIGDMDSVDSIRLQSARNNSHIKGAVVLAMAKLEPENCYPTLEKAAQSGDRNIRLAAAQAYGLVGRSPQDQKVMVGLVSDDDEEVALWAIRSLSQISVNTKAMAALHDSLRHTNPKFIRVAMEVIEVIGKKEYSGRHLLNVVKNTALEMDIREQAAKTLFRLKDKDGMMELAKSYKAQIKNQPRSVRAHEALGVFYVEFGAWELGAKAYSKALDVTRNATQQRNMRLEIARCWARADKFKRAANYLKKTGRDGDWQDLVGDPAFAKMKEVERYRDNFYE
ncbi:MAG: tetratricopeptide (TPR) repeat protein [Planctomycetota bacterium]|jgi:tetratricopeptide (TPR) repeat protein